ncbi:MAG: hypothetical protein MR522_08205 [Trueperella sp.]|uniref:hypothetical protein n=1 Tax=Trueperella TaxID=1069494 RepID=UPI0025FB21E4|nr:MULTISPECIES: hypothetical protein [Trueperella]MCI7306226.1 hypothetical protein [Trueperella sp.]MDY5403604.1 hypothetical protein [Trueperella sp.]
METLNEPATPGIRYTHAHTTGVQADSVTERAVVGRARLDTELEQIDEAATSTGWRSTALDGPPLWWLTVRADWGSRNGPEWSEHVERLETIHRRWQTACEPPSEISGHLCPACGRANLNWAHKDRLYRCPACDYAGTLEHVTNLCAHVIAHADVWGSRDMACALFGLTRERLKKHVQRGNLHPREGLFSTVALRGLPRRT